jgi:hypothetical protein
MKAQLRTILWLAAAGLASAVAACSPDDGSAPGDEQGGAPGRASGTGVTTLTLEHEPVTFDQPLTAYVTLSGSDRQVADASASVVERYEIEVRALPVELELTIPKNPHERIDQGHGPTARENANYYFSVTIDVGRDGKVCANDFVQDFDRTDFSVFGEAPPDDYTIIVKEYGDRCQPLDR